METTYIALAVFALFAALGLLLLELHLRSLRTRVLQVPGGLRFEAHTFSVQFQRSEKAVHVQCARAVLVPAGAAPGQKPAPAGRVEYTFAALGFRAEVRESVSQAPGQVVPVRTGLSEIALRGSDGALLTITHLHENVVADFAAFFRQVQHWIDKLEQRQERERVERLRSEEEAAQLQQHAELMARLASPAAPDEAAAQAGREALAAAQIGQWRRSAGFEGQHSLWHTEANGVVSWFIDLAADGRITLHADKRTLHSTLRGATIASIGGGLLLGVRDAHWTEQEPELREFRVLRGCSADERRAWKERLELIRNSLAP